MSVSRLVVVGASLAGLRAVETARRAGFAGRVTLIGAERHLPYDRPPLSKAFLAGGSGGFDDDSLTFRTREHLTEDLDVEVLVGKPADGLDTTARLVEVGDRLIPYDAVVIATGGRPRTLPFGADLDGVTTLRTRDDALVVRKALRPGARVVVVGAGIIGSEIAASAHAAGAMVTVVEAAPTPLARAVGTRMGAALSDLHRRHGTTLLTGVGVSDIVGDGRVDHVVLADGTRLPADLVVVGVGIDPEVSWLAGSGLTLDDGVRCDATLWTGRPGVYAAGDVANWPNPAFGGLRQRMENWTAAAEQGAAAARNAVDPEHAKPYATVPYFWTDWYGRRIQFVGSAAADDVEVVDGDLEGDRWVALYRTGDRLVGALTLQGQADVMKYRALIAENGSWADGHALAAQRRQRREARAAAAEVPGG